MRIAFFRQSFRNIDMDWRVKGDMYSFDVFDTLITRTVATPYGIFALMKDRIREERDRNGLDDHVIDNFFELRIHGERLARKAAAGQGIEERNLYDIYAAIALCGCLSEEQIIYLCHLEQEIEITNVLPISDNIQRLKHLLAQGERVVLISDMYLSKEIIYKMLVQVDPVFKKIPLYVSSEYGMRKTTGNLYRQVQQLEQVNYEDWTHVGDDLFQDIEMPYRLGIKVGLYPKVQLDDFEKKILEDHGDESRLQLMIGTAVKVENIFTDQTETVLRRAYHVGSRYAGPLLYCYAEWIIEQALKKKIKRLYFVARDGYLIKKIVDILLTERKIEMVTKYIYGSRKAWRFPSLSVEHYDLYQLIDWSHINRIHTLAELADILHVPLQDLYIYLPGTYEKDKDSIHISGQELEYIAEKLSSNAAFKNYHLRKLEPERKLAQQYLAQEIDMEDDYFAFVDVAGGGLTQGCVQRLIRDRYQKPVRTFFFRIDRVNLVEDSITDIFIPCFPENQIIVEMLCRAPHGQTKGYMDKCGKIIPILEDIEDQALIEHGFYAYENGVLDFSKRMCAVSTTCGRKIASMRNVLLYLQHIAEKPSEDVLEYFGSMPSSESGRGKTMVEYAPRLTEHDIKEIFLRRTYEPIETFYKGTNLGYSILRATKEEKDLIEWCKKEHDQTFGKLYRQEDERVRKRARDCYGRAAFYPIRMLEERIILYGAGKFGRDLYHRLDEDKEHEIIRWVDKMASIYRQRGLAEVQDVSEIDKIPDVQIVIAVVREDIAKDIRGELERMGVDKERILWIWPYDHPDPQVQWKKVKMG